MILLLVAIVSAAIRVDQIGYPANAPKVAVVGEAAESFELFQDNRLAFTGKTSAPSLDRDSGDRLRLADFSAITTPGNFTLRAAGETANVVIANDPYASLLRLAMRAYTGQRCGTAVDIGGGYAHPACHVDSPVKGGWHDAGDYGRYVVNAGISTGTLLWACELFGLDMLDEIRWNADWMLSMQDRDGSVWHKETSKEFPPFVAPQDDHSAQLLIGKSSCATGDFAAVMAIAARVYKKQQYLDAAERAFAWLEKNPNVTFRNPPDIKTGEYGDRDCSDERLWAAAELWRTSGDEHAQAYFLRHWRKAFVTPADWSHVGALAAWSYVLSGRTSEPVASQIVAATVADADEIVLRAQRDPYRIPMRSRDYVWGSNAVAANYGVELLVANVLKPHRAYVDATLEIIHYLLGRNSFSMSWVTGAGTNAVKHPHHRPSASDHIDAPWPGLLAGGPNQHRQDPVLRRLPRGVPPARMYADDQESYASNEVAINWNAPLVFILAGVKATGPAVSAQRVALFRATGFPTIDAPAVSQRSLDEALSGFHVDTLDDLRNLKRDTHDLLLLSYGSAFPLEAWPQIRDFLHRGGSLIILGGAPLSQPVLHSATGEWQLGVRQPSFAHELLIGPAEAVSATGFRPKFPDESWSLPIENARTVWELTLRLGTRADLPNESGAQAPREAVVHPLVHLVDGDGIPRACPLVEIDRLRGDDAGARWIFSTSDAPMTAAIIRALVTRALEGASNFDVRPVPASLEPGEVPTLRITDAKRPVRIVVRDDGGAEVFRGDTAAANVDVRAGRPLRPGLYHVEALECGAALQNCHTARTGFWIRDAALLSNGPRMTLSRDWMRRDGKVFPIIGTTYMASDVHRHFLFEPNPEVWDRDFEQMSRLGINFVRTGLWTAWSRIDDDALRSLDAYVQTAAKHGIVVCFTFFAFQPPLYGGTNPFLDPRSIEGQRAFITSIARRYRGSKWVQYDLINEPSYAPADRLWTNQPIRDESERNAWQEWVRARHGDDVTVLRNLWQDPRDDFSSLPDGSEIWPAQVREDRRPRKAYDFVLFSQEAVASWARTLREALRDAGGNPIVTLGQDEGGTGTRSSQQLHEDAVDYTSVHPWWENDEVLSTGVFVKVPEKPSLFQETGLMRLEDVSGWPWRSPELAAAALERKYAYAFASRSAGVVEWAWNINPYMPIDNESVIGFFRPDGTAKPELDVVPRFAAFFREAAPYLDDFDRDDVVIVIPQSRLFLNRPAALDGYRRSVRLLAENFGIVPAAISDLRLTAEQLRGAKLVIIPSVEFLDRGAAEALLAASRAGTNLLVIGAVTGDPYGDVPVALQDLGIVDAGRPVRFREWTAAGWATFDRNLQESLLCSTAPRSAWHEPLPLDHGREDAPLADLFKRALNAAGVAVNASDDHVALRLLTAPRSILAVLINETSNDASRLVVIAGKSSRVDVAAGRTRLVLYDRQTGTIIAQTR